MYVHIRLVFSENATQGVIHQIFSRKRGLWKTRIISKTEKIRNHSSVIFKSLRDWIKNNIYTLIVIYMLNIQIKKIGKISKDSPVAGWLVINFSHKSKYTTKKNNTRHFEKKKLSSQNEISRKPLRYFKSF